MRKDSWRKPIVKAVVPAQWDPFVRGNGLFDIVALKGLKTVTNGTVYWSVVNFAESDQRSGCSQLVWKVS